MQSNSPLAEAMAFSALNNICLTNSTFSDERYPLQFTYWKLLLLKIINTSVLGLTIGKYCGIIPMLKIYTKGFST